MEIHILLAGEQLGPFSETQVRQYLDEGLVAPSDLATYGGLETWQSIDQILAHFRESAAVAGTISADSFPPGHPSDENPTPESTPSLTMHRDTPETLESAPSSSPTENLPPLTATQKTRRKPGKIVIQPILPLEVTAPLRKKPRTGKTALTLEPLRPTTSLPPITGPLPREKKTTGKTLIRQVQMSLRDLSDPPEPSRAALPPPAPPEAPVASSPPVPSRLPPPLLEIAAETRARKTPLASRPPVMLYASAGIALLVVCLILATLYLTSAPREEPPAASPPPTAPASPAPSPAQAENQSRDAAPKTAADYRAAGLALQAKGDIAGAVQDYSQALILDPKDIEAFYHRALAHQAAGDSAGALADYTQVLSLDPKRANAYGNRGFVKQGQGDYDGALADYNQALLLDPKIPGAYYNEGLIEVQKGNLDSAISAYDHALDLDPKMAVAYYNRGVAKNTEGNLDGAIADYTRAITLNPGIARAYCDRGFARQSKGDPVGALADYAQALALNPNMADVYYNRALIKMQKGDLDGAIADENQSIELDPKNGLAYDSRGLGRFGKNDFKGASSDLGKFCELLPRDGGTDTARLYLWLSAAEENSKDDADRQLSTSLQNDWNSPPEDLISKIAAFLLGHISENELIANAASPDPAREPPQYCKVWYFAGMKRLLAGDKPTAVAYFQKCVDTAQKDACEYTFAQAELQALGPTGRVATQPQTGP